MTARRTIGLLALAAVALALGMSGIMPILDVHVPATAQTSR